MRRITCGAALALIMTAVAVPTASADEPGTGGTPIAPPAATPVGAPAATPATSGTTTPGISATRAVKLTRPQTKSVQRKVRVRADGSLGARTRTALRRYQKQKTLTPTGQPNLETLKAMRLSFATSIERKLAATTHASSAATPAAIAAAIDATRTQIGTPYRNAGTSPGGFDCSGLMVWAFKQAGIDLPRTSFDQYAEGTAVDEADILPGDLVFFSTAGRGASHVGIATGPTTVISATSSGVMEHHLDDDYWGAAYVGARRLAAS